MESEETTKVEVESPYTEKPEFDYNAYRDTTMGGAVTAIFQILGNNAELLTYKSDATEETITEAEDKVTKEIMEAIIENNVAEGDMQTLFDTFPVVIHRLFSVISRMKKEYEKELLARVLNGRNPGDQHYSREYSTLKDLFETLEKVRTEQESDPYGYFYSKQKEV